MNRSKKKKFKEENLMFTKAAQVGKPFYVLEEYKEMVQSEDDLQRACEKYLLSTGWVKAGLIEKRVGQVIRGVFVHIPNQVFGKNTVARDWLKNLPDLICYHPDGRYISFELKAKIGKKSKGQIAIAKYMQIQEERVFENFVKSLEAWYFGL